jgi:hypothetical protein
MKMPAANVAAATNDKKTASGFGSDGVSSTVRNVTISVRPFFNVVEPMG